MRESFKPLPSEGKRVNLAETNGTAARSPIYKAIRQMDDAMALTQRIARDEGRRIKTIWMLFVGMAICCFAAGVAFRSLAEAVLSN